MEQSHFRRVRIVTKSTCYCPLPRRMHLTCATWVDPWTGVITVRGKRTDHVKETRIPFTASPSFRWSPFDGCSVYNKPKANICPALTAQNATEHNCTVVHARNTAAFQDDVFLTEIYRVSQEECARLRKSVPYVKLYRYNPKHLYPKLNGYGDNDQIIWNLDSCYTLIDYQIRIETGRNMWFL